MCAFPTEPLPVPDQLLSRLSTVTRTGDVKTRVLATLKEVFGAHEITIYHHNHGKWSATFTNGEQLSLAHVEDSSVARCLSTKAEVREAESPGCLALPLFFEEVLVGAVKLVGDPATLCRVDAEYAPCFTFAALVLACGVQQESHRLESSEEQQRTKGPTYPSPQMRARRQLRRNELGDRAQILSMIRFAPVGIFRIDNQGRCVFLNERGAEVLGLSYQEALGKQWSSVIHPEDQPRLKESWEQTVLMGGVLKDEFRIVRPKGGAAWVLLQGFPSLDHAGRMAGCIGMLVDISEHKRNEQSLLQQNQAMAKELSQKSLQLEVLARESALLCYAISHDLRAPARAINGYVQILLEEQAERLDTKGREQLAHIAGSSVKMGELIDALLQYAQLGRQEVRQSSFDLKKLVQEIYRELALNHSGSQPQLRLDLARLPKVVADREMTRLALRHLLDNARKATHNRKGGYIEVGSRQEGGEQIVYVKDNGIGYDCSYQDKLFGLFQKLHDVSEFNGTGAGLAIVQRVANKHGGRVWAESTLNQGATFYLCLPSKENAASHLTSDG